MAAINVTTLKAIISSLGYKEIKNITTTSFGVVVAKTQVEKVIPALMAALKAYKPKLVSTRQLEVGGFSVYAKNREQQRGIKAHSFGRGNEWTFVSTLREWIVDYGKPLKVTFTERDGQSTFTACNIVKVEHTGAKNIFERKKADVHLVSDKNQSYPLSIKDESAGYWESADSYWGLKSAKFVNWALQNAQTQLDENGAGGFSLRPTIAIPATLVETKDVVFGTDIFGHGAIIVRKFRPENFVWDYKTDTLMVNCAEVITRPEHVKGDHQVFFEVRNERNRNPKHLYRGLRAMASMKGNLRGDKLFTAADRGKIGI